MPRLSEVSIAELSGRKGVQRKAGALLLAAVLGILYFAVPAAKREPPAPEPTAAAQLVLPVTPGMPREYVELSPQLQRMVEGHYNMAMRSAELEEYERAVGHLRKIHDYLPYYKQSRDLLDEYANKAKAKQIATAVEKARRDEKQDLAIYLDEGDEYLKDGDFDRAAESFNSAIVIEPSSERAIRGLKAAELKLRRIGDLPVADGAESLRRQLVAELFQKAVAAFTRKEYTTAIATAESIKRVTLVGDTQYLSEAQTIIDRARLHWREEFDPFLTQAMEKLAEGDYAGALEICDEMLKRDGANPQVRACAADAREKLKGKRAPASANAFERMRSDEYFRKIQKSIRE